MVSEAIQGHSRAINMLDTMTAGNWAAVRKAMKKIGKKNKKQADSQNMLPAVGETEGPDIKS